MKEELLTINFSSLGGPLYSGRDRGEEVRRKLNLSSVDKQDIKIKVIIPESTYSVTSSFFLGMLGDSVRACGSTTLFLNKFNFVCPEHMLAKFIDYADRALREKKPLL